MGKPEQRIIDFALRLSQYAETTYVITSSEPERAICVEQYVSAWKHVCCIRDKREVAAGTLIDYRHIFEAIDPTSDVIVLAPDHVHGELDICEFHKHHIESNSDLTLLTVLPKSYGEYTMAVGVGYATGVLKHPIVGAVSTCGTYIVKIKYIQEWIRECVRSGWQGKPLSFYRDIVCPVIERGLGAIYQLPYGGYWDDAGTHERYFFNNMRISGGENVISPDSYVDTGAKIYQCVILGGTVIGKRIAISRSIVSGVVPQLNITPIY